MNLFAKSIAAGHFFQLGLKTFPVTAELLESIQKSA